MAEAAAKVYLNRLINCIDPGKDAGVKKGGLTNPVHGEFLKELVLEPLFKLSELDPADQDLIVGVGDKKGDLKQKIDSAIRLKDLDNQCITRVKTSDTGFDPRTEGYYLAHDAGPRPAKLSSDYTLVLTPASVLDPAPRDNKHEPKVNGLAESSEISSGVLDNIAMNILKSIKFSYTGGQYKFTLKTEIPGYENVDLIFRPLKFKNGQDAHF